MVGKSLRANDLALAAVVQFKSEGHGNGVLGLSNDALGAGSIDRTHLRVDVIAALQTEVQSEVGSIGAPVQHVRGPAPLGRPLGCPQKPALLFGRIRADRRSWLHLPRRDQVANVHANFCDRCRVWHLDPLDSLAIRDRGREVRRADRQDEEGQRKENLHHGTEGWVQE